MIQEEKCKWRYQNFEAKVLPWSTDKIWGFDWKNGDGSSTHAIRYILDIEKGNLMITGDWGCAVASWYNEVLPQKLPSLVHDIGYFSGKVRCGTDLYTYYPIDIEEDLDEVERIWRRQKNDSWDAVINETMEKLRAWFKENDVHGTDYPKAVTDLFEIFDRNWHYSTYLQIGKRISERVYMWQIGLLMAFDQIEKNSEKE